MASKNKLDYGRWTFVLGFTSVPVGIMGIYLGDSLNSEVVGTLFCILGFVIQPILGLIIGIIGFFRSTIKCLLSWIGVLFCCATIALDITFVIFIIRMAEMLGKALQRFSDFVEWYPFKNQI